MVGLAPGRSCCGAWAGNTICRALLGGWIPSRVAMVKVVDGAQGVDPEQSWQQDLEDLPEEYVVQQANITSTVAVPLDKQQTVDLEADE